MDRDFLYFALLIVLIFPLLFKRKTKHQIKRDTADRIIKAIGKIEHPGQKIAYLRTVDPYAFEELILTLLQRKGFVIARNSRYSGDGGIDGRFQHEKQVWLIQAKRYSYKIKLDHVREFTNLLNAHQCNGIFVHTGITPASARSIAESCEYARCEIISGDRLLALFDTSVKQTF